MNSLNLIQKLSRQEEQFFCRDFVSPFVENQTSIVVKVEGVVYRLRVGSLSGAGLGIFKPTSKSSAMLVREANFDEIEQYFSKLPKLHMIVVDIRDWVSVGVPLNASVVKQKIGLDGSAPVFLVKDVEIFDDIRVAFDGVNFWFVEPSFLTMDLLEQKETMRKKLNSNNLNAARVKVPKNLQVAWDVALQKRKEELEQTVEGKIQAALESTNAKLDSIVARGDIIEVKWINNSGQPYTTCVKRDDLTVVTAGICMNDGHSRFDLKSLVSVVSQGEKKNKIFRVGNNPHLGGPDDEEW